MWKKSHIQGLIQKLSLVKYDLEFLNVINTVHSTIIPERLDIFINKYAEHTHDKWAFEKVSFENCSYRKRNDVMIWFSF